MHDIFTGIQSINCTFQCGISLRYCFSCLFIYFIKIDLCCHTVIAEGMGKRYGCFFIIGVRKLERIHIFCISYITFRCLIFFYRIGISDWQVYCEFGSSVCASSYFLNQRSFFHNNASVCISDIIGCIQSKNTAFQWFLGIFILFYNGNICFLSLVVKSHICKYNFFVLTSIS